MLHATFIPYLSASASHLTTTDLPPSALACAGVQVSGLTSVPGPYFPTGAK